MVVSVSDNGIGMSPEVRDNVFDLFFQGGRTAARSEGGLGIGLALVKNLVQLHGGTVTARSDGPGCGSEFTVWLPAARGDESPMEAAGKSSIAAGLDPSQPAQRVLLVDDNRDAIETLGALLRASGHDVQIAHDAASALQLLNAFTPEVAILDIGLPVMDGYELLEQMRKRADLASCRFVALTGYGQDGDRSRSRASGFVRHLVKPVQHDIVLSLLAEICPGGERSEGKEPFNRAAQAAGKRKE